MSGTFPPGHPVYIYIYIYIYISSEFQGTSCANQPVSITNTQTPHVQVFPLVPDMLLTSHKILTFLLNQYNTNITHTTVYVICAFS